MGMLIFGLGTLILCVNIPASAGTPDDGSVIDTVYDLIQILGGIRSATLQIGCHHIQHDRYGFVVLLSCNIRNVFMIGFYNI